jgi:hypothetical protein
MTSRIRSLGCFALVAFALLASSPAHAGLGKRDAFQWSWVDSKGTSGPRVIPRYVTPPALAAGATGNGAMDHPTLPAQLWNNATGAVVIPVENFTLTATSATTFSVVGTVSGTLADATVGTPYNTAAGMNFTITAGTTPFAAGDKLTFSVVDHVNASAIPGAVSKQMPAGSFLIVPNPGFTLQTEGLNSGGAIIVYAAGYLAMTSTTSPRFLEDYYPPASQNTDLPARIHSHSRAVPVMPFWDDLVPKATSRVWTATVGRVGSRAFVIEYNDFAHKDDAAASLTFQVVFFENGGSKLRFHYIAMSGSHADGSSASIGVQPHLTARWAADAYSVNTGSVANGLTIELGVDSDGDRLPDQIETQYGTSSGTRFTDGGSPAISDSGQILAGLNPVSGADNASMATDTDADTIVDVEEAALGTNPNAKDTDADGLDDNIELNVTDPLVADTDGDGLSDGQEDTDKSGSVTGTETSPLIWDTDDDGISDGTEVAQSTDPKLNTSSRLTAALQLGAGSVQNLTSAADSKGNLHVAWVTRVSSTRNNTPNELHVALLSATGGVYAISVADTLIDAHTGMDDSIPSIVTTPGAGAVDRTFIVNGTPRGYSFVTEIDFNAAARDGTASTSALLVKATRMLAIGVGVDHPVVKLAGGKLHLVFQGQETQGYNQFSGQQATRGTKYVHHELNGDVTVQPTLMFQKGGPAHHRTLPRIAVDGMGNVHSVVRGGTCRYNQGPTGCDLYYTKLSSAGAVLVPTTKLQLEGNGGYHRSPEILVSPNGLVNVIYSTTAPVVAGNNGSTYQIGNEVRLYSFAVINNQIQTVINQKTLMSSAPGKSTGLATNTFANAYRTPTATLDAGGNIHLVVCEDNNLSDGEYRAFAPNGDPKIGPIYVRSYYYWGLDSIALAGSDSVLFTYKISSGNRPQFRKLDISGSNLDLSGNSQVPLPTAGALTVTGVSPAVVGVDSRTVLTVSGTGFVAGAQFSVGGVATTNVQAFDASNILGKLDSTTLAPGVYDVVVQNPDGAMATLAGALTVTAGTEPVPEPEPTPTDDGCCHVGGKSPIGSALLAAFVLLGLARRRRRRALPAAGALLVVAALVAPRAAHAGLGTPDTAGWNWVDTKGATGVHLIPRYATPPVLGAGATGNGTINYPTLPAQLWSYTANAPTIPLETFTLTATSATSFNVVGSVSGTLAVATVGTTYTTAAGMNFTITAGTTPFAAGDHFDFAITDHINAATAPGATSFQVPAYGHVLLPAPGFTIYTEGNLGNRSLVAYDAGYAMFTNTTQPEILSSYYPRNGANTALPARLLAHDRSVPVMPFWDDLVSKSTSRIWTATVGRPGTRNFIVEWNDFAHKTDATASFTFQAVFFEGTERVRFHYIKMTNGSGTSGNGSGATVGLQARLNSQYAAAAYSVNASTIADGLAIDFSRDFDGDHVPSAIEVQYGTSDGNRFTDGGTPAVSDGGQLQNGLDPTNPADNGTKGTDTDGDTIVDVDEQVLGTNPAAKDTDADGLDDNLEISTGTEPLVADTDGDGLTDGQEDADKSGNVTVTETSPVTWDTDGDGVGDGTEVAQSTDPLASASGRMSVPIALASLGNVYNEESSLDSKGNLHVMWVRNRTANNTPDELFVALLQPTGGVYAVTVASTAITAHAGVDDRMGTIVTMPGAGAIDRTFIVNSVDSGYAFLTEIDFNAAARDGNASTSATLVASTRMIPVSLGADHPVVKESGGKLAVVFQGQELVGSPDKFARNQIARGTYYMQLSLTGDVLVQPTLLFQKGLPAHHHHFPQIAVDGMGNVHSVVRGGTCRKSQGPTDCALYYTKLSSAGATMIPTTKLQLEGNGGLHRSPTIAISPNGLVNILYSTSAPMITANGSGAYSVGNEVRLHSFSTVNNQITTVINQKTLLSYAPDRTMALPGNQRLASWRIPFVSLDAGGNLHVFVVEDNVSSQMGFYFAFAPNGDKKLGPYKLPQSNYWGTDSLHATATQVLFSTKYNGDQAGFRQLDITGSGLDLTGASLVPVPDADILVLRSVSPDTVAVGTGKIVVTIAGAGFVSGTAVAIGGVPVANTLAYDGGTVIGELDATGLAEGPYDVVVQNPNGAIVTLTGGFYVGERPGPEPEPEPTPTDDGCCSIGGGHPVSSLLLAGVVVGVLFGRRRRRR